MKLLRDLSTYTYTRSGSMVISLIELAIATASLSIVLTSQELVTAANECLLALAAVCLFAGGQNVVRLLRARKQGSLVIAPLSRRQRYWALVAAITLALMAFTVPTFLTVNTTTAATLPLGDPCQISMLRNDVGGCLCMGISLGISDDRPPFIQRGFPFTIHDNACSGSYWDTYLSDPNYLAAALDILGAVAIDLIVAIAYVMISRKVARYV